jgi:hypothetical protein
MKLEDLQPTMVFERYWRFAAERHTIYERRLKGHPQPWTTDPILSQYKFTNAFRASDRVSQHLIRHVIYQSGGSMDDEEVVFRILLFKLFNSIPASNALKAGLGGVPSRQSFDEKNYGRILGEAKARGVNIWNAAYTQNQLYRTDLKTKHERYLALIKRMMNDGVTRKLKAARTYEEAYLVLRTYPIHGEFIAMQHLTDINYSPVINFSENDFIVAGPGALDGMQKCFGFRPDAEQAAEIIKMCVDEQKRFFRTSDSNRSRFSVVR